MFLLVFCSAHLSLAQESNINSDPSELPLVFREDFEKGDDRWETTDAAAWTRKKVGDSMVFGLNKRISNYQPEFRSPHNIALIKSIKLKDFELMLDVKNTKDTGNHRDCCVFFNYQDKTHFYYAHLGAMPDPHSGQIMIVNGAPRKAMTQNEKNFAWDDDWHKVKVVRDSSSGKIEVFFDDMTTPCMSVVDKTFGAGQIGIGSFDDMNDFDNIILRGK